MLQSSTASCEGSTNLPVSLHDAKTTLYKTNNTYEAENYHKVVIMGAGSLGQSLVPVTPNNGIRVVGMFDTDPGKIGLTFSNGVVVESEDYLPTCVIQHCVERGIIAVPAIDAQNAANALVEAGVRVILNYAPVNLNVPINVQCERVDPAVQFSRITVRPLPTIKIDHKTLLGSILSQGIPYTSTEESKATFNATRAKEVLFWKFPLVIKRGKTAGTDEEEHLYIEQVLHDHHVTTEQGDEESFFSFLVSERQRQQRRESVKSSALCVTTSSMYADSVYPAHDLSFTVQKKDDVLSCGSCDTASVESPSGLRRPRGSKSSLDSEMNSSRWRVRKRPSCVFKDVAGLDLAKSALLETLKAQESCPTSFNRLLMYGPPGCGKSMLSRAVSSELFEEYTFFHVPAADLMLSRNDCGVTLRSLFEDAAAVTPAVVVIDNIDVLCKHKSSKAELIAQLELLSQSSENVILLAVTNLPWDVDITVFRHFEKRVFVTLPGLRARKAMFRNCPQIKKLSENKQCERYLGNLAKLTRGYSCSDICLVIKDALMRPSRRNQEQGEVNFEDFILSCKEIRPTISKEICQVYKTFATKFGQLSYMTDDECEEPKHMSMYS